MRLRHNPETLSFYRAILAAERAGVEALSGLLKEVEDGELKSVLERFLRDEGMNCQIFSTLIRNAGEAPGSATGDFAQKIQRLDNIDAKLNLLARGQEWVARRIRTHRPLLVYGAEAVFMEAIKIQHEENVDFLKRRLGPA